MGGRGSGRQMRWTKSYCESYLHLDIRKIARAGRLKPYEFFSWQWIKRDESRADIAIRVGDDIKSAELFYRARYGGGEYKQIEERIGISWSNCSFGGKRPWWICPGCGQRVAILYGGMYFRCRHCYGLAYACQSENYHDRLLRKTHKFKRRLGEYLTRPKGMHQKTYERLRKRAMLLEDTLNLSFIATVERLWPEIINKIKFWPENKA
jgi:hypothetical protein